MSDKHNAIIVAVTGLLTGVAGWLFGGKQKLKIDSNDVLTKGADSIVETSNKLLTMLQVMVEEERDHRKSCEESLKEHKNLISKLDSEIKQLKRKL
jgi:hypothetical protein